MFHSVGVAEHSGFACSWLSLKDVLNLWDSLHRGVVGLAGGEGELNLMRSLELEF